ncbi:MAG: hypothetical protein QM689_06730 [Oscillospiraceae bacterium]
MPECCASGEELAMLASSIAVALAKDKTLDELVVLHYLVKAVDENLDLIAAQRALCKKKQNK